MPSSGEYSAGSEIATELIGDIYDCAADPNVWQSLLSLLCEFERGNAALLGSQNPVTHAMRIRTAVKVPAGYLRSYAKRFARCDAWAAQSTEACRPGTIWMEDVGAHAELEDGSGGFYRDWLQPQGISHLLRAVVGHRDPKNPADPSVIWIAIGRNNEAGPFSDRDRETLEAILPHLRRVLEIHATVDRLRAQCRAAMATFDHLPIGVVLLDRQRRVVVMNRQAREIIRQSGSTADIIRSALRQSRGPQVLPTASGKESRISGGLVERTADASWYGALSRRPLIAIMRRLDTDGAEVGAQEPTAALFLSDPEDEAHIDDAMVRRLYGLTSAEARLAVLLAQGHHLDEVAGILRISIHTARTHLKRTLAKTHTARQSDLVRLLLNPCTQLRV
jgi:DNA-binding CsgD family transcriptional regulator